MSDLVKRIDLYLNGSGSDPDGAFALLLEARNQLTGRWFLRETVNGIIMGVALAGLFSFVVWLVR